MSAERLAVLSLSGPLLALAGGCELKDLYHRFQNEDPSVRVMAIVEAERTRDPKALPYVVDCLTDSETEVRYAAIMALRDMTGRTMGYRYYDPPDRREAAVEMWRQWLRSRSPAGRSPASGPASAPADAATGPASSAASRRAPR